MNLNPECLLAETIPEFADLITESVRHALTYVVGLSKAAEDVDEVLEVHMLDCGQPSGQPWLLRVLAPHRP